MPRNGSSGVSCTIFGSVAKTDSQAILGLEAGSLAGEPGSGIHRKWLVHGYGMVDTMPPVMSKAYWRIIQDEIEAKGWTVTRAVKPQPGGGLHHIVTAR